jgi:hypothetical protein
LWFSWDCASEEEESLIHSAHAQHVDRAAEFLVAQMKSATSRNEVERQRMFFVSSKEVIEEMTTGKTQQAQSRLGRERKREWER